MPVLAAGLVAWARAGRAAARRWSDPRVMAVGPSPRARRLRAAAALVALLAVAAGAVAMARPSVEDTRRQQRSTVMVTLDVSESMVTTDLAPSRLDAALDAARRLVDGAPARTAIGLTTFADRATVVLAPTDDRLRIREALDTVGETRVGTALGAAVTASLAALTSAGAVPEAPPADPSDSPARILVLTDGANSIRRATSPEAAAERAAQAGVPIYTILLGDDPGRPDQPLPAETLSAMATRTGGIFAQSTSAGDLRVVFDDIGSIVAPVEGLRELTVWVAAAAALLLLVAGALLALARAPCARRPGARRLAPRRIV
ncbi:vWA domain-containing protein [Miltoncostaea marina]|uniref:vWA domain-containing protein n=1 Tax=Miltoncostaea marina TaxID=2843215 RepID=UPI001C3DB31A|nr:VWA domain-containing protein [Miltoncostaea marina]